MGPEEEHSPVAIVPPQTVPGALKSLSGMQVGVPQMPTSSSGAGEEKHLDSSSDDQEGSDSDGGAAVAAASVAAAAATTTATAAGAAAAPSSGRATTPIVADAASKVEGKASSPRGAKAAAEAPAGSQPWLLVASAPAGSLQHPKPRGVSLDLSSPGHSAGGAPQVRRAASVDTLEQVKGGADDAEALQSELRRVSSAISMSMSLRHRIESLPEERILELIRLQPVHSSGVSISSGKDVLRESLVFALAESVRLLRSQDEVRSSLSLVLDGLGGEEDAALVRSLMSAERKSSGSHATAASASFLRTRMSSARHNLHQPMLESAHRFHGTSPEQVLGEDFLLRRASGGSGGSFHLSPRDAASSSFSLPSPRGSVGSLGSWSDAGGGVGSPGRAPSGSSPAQPGGSPPPADSPAQPAPAALPVKVDQLALGEPDGTLLQPPPPPSPLVSSSHPPSPSLAAAASVASATLAGAGVAAAAAAAGVGRCAAAAAAAAAVATTSAAAAASATRAATGEAAQPPPEPPAHLPTPSDEQRTLRQPIDSLLATTATQEAAAAHAAAEVLLQQSEQLRDHYHYHDHNHTEPRPVVGAQQRPGPASVSRLRGNIERTGRSNSDSSSGSAASAASGRGGAAGSGAAGSGAAGSGAAAAQAAAKKKGFLSTFVSKVSRSISSHFRRGKEPSPGPHGILRHAGSERPTSSHSRKTVSFGYCTFIDHQGIVVTSRIPDASRLGEESEPDTMEADDAKDSEGRDDALAIEDTMSVA